MEAFEQIALTQIDPNPYQPREKTDPEHIQKLAASIASSGLLQIPSGRRAGDRVQLAFGHSRFAAFQLLWQIQSALMDHQPMPFEFAEDTPLATAVSQADKCLNAGVRFDTMPLAIHAMDDDEMFRAAVRENMDRKDLSALETAKAMIRYRDEFHKSSAQIGALFGMSESAVRNKMRLLQLPTELQDTLGRVSELVLREILTLLDLPQALRDAGERNWNLEIKPSAILRDAAAGETAELLHRRIDALISSYGAKMNGDWKLDHVFPESPSILGLCKGCRYLLKRDKQSICLNRSCHEAKAAAARHEYLAAASQACGIPVLEDETKSFYETSYFGYGEGQRLDQARAAGCQNLRLIFGNDGTAGSLKKEGYPNAMVICGKRKGFCTCQQAMNAGIDLTKPRSSTSEEKSTNESPRTLTAEDLSEIARAARKQKRENAAQVRELASQTTKLFGDGLQNMNLGAWRKLLERLSPYGQSQKTSDSELVYAVARVIVESICPSIGEVAESDPARALKKYNSALISAGLSELDLPTSSNDVSTETVNCPDCQQPMKRSVEPDGWVWYRCTSCDRWQPTEERGGKDV
jgi:ParB-like chromosome segregation protein Spo0J